MRKNEVLVEDIIKEDYVQSKSRWNGPKYNKTTKFCLPMLELNITGKALSKYLVNAFINDKSLEHDMERPLFLLMSVYNLKDKLWTDFNKIINERSFYKDAYIMDYFIGKKKDSTLIMYVFQVPEKWANDFELFKQGRYSLMSDEYKKKFPREVSLPTGERTEGKEWGIMNKSTYRKDLITKEFVNPYTSTNEEVIRLRRSIDNWDEIWDKVWPEEEVYHYEEVDNDN